MSQKNNMDEKMKDVSQEARDFVHGWLDDYGLPKGFNFTSDLYRELRNAEFKETDVVVYTFPKSGTTWMQALLALLVFGEEKVNSPGFLLENECWLLELNTNGLSEKMMKTKTDGPRIIKTHLPRDMLPSDIQQNKAKIIYVLRDPKDVCVSLYKYLQNMTFARYAGSFADYHKMFLIGCAGYSGFTWLDHVRDMWTRPHENVIFVTYEDMSKDFKSVIRKVAKFLNKERTEEQVDKIAHMLKFDVMKKNKNINMTTVVDTEEGFYVDPEKGLLRKGIVGDYKSEMTPKMAEEINKAFLDPLKALGLDFVI